MDIKYLTPRIIHQTYKVKAITLYSQGFSAPEIKEILDIKHTPRQIQQWMKVARIIRTRGEAFRLAISKGRVRFYRRRRRRRISSKLQ